MIRINDKNENTWIILGFILSLFHWGLCAAFFAVLAYQLYRQGIPGCLKVLLIVTVRCLLSTTVARPINGIVQAEKWAIIFLLSFSIIKNAGMYEKPKYIRTFGGTLALFAAYIILTSFFASDYPLVSVFKVLSYAIPFYAVAIGVAVTNEEWNWIHYMKQVMTLIIYACILTIPFSGRFNIVNGTFQGVLNHPNLMGIFLAIFIGCILFDKEETKGIQNILFYFILVLSFYMLYRTASRTGMFSALICLAVYWYGLPGPQKTRGVGLLIIAFIVVGGIYLVLDPSSELMTYVRSFVYKRTETGLEDLFDSRRLQIIASKEKFSVNPSIGAGFGVPYNNGEVNWSFSMSMTYESGNLYYTLLGDTGWVGMILFVLNMFSIMLHTPKKKLALFALPIIISLGEMAFFSTNNIAILYYFFYGICLSPVAELIYKEEVVYTC